MKTPKYYAGREIDYYLLWIMGVLAAITIVSVLLGGCASTPSPCHKVCLERGYAGSGAFNGECSCYRDGKDAWKY